MKLQSWYHCCFVIDFSGGSITIVVNGFTVCKNRIVDSLKDGEDRKPKFVKNKIIIGKFYMTELKIYYQFLWKIANVNLYDNNLTEAELKNITKNACTQRGTFLAWDEITWKISGSPKVINVPSAEICTDSEKVFIAVPAKLNFYEAKLGCQNLGNGRIHAPNTEREFLSFYFWYLQIFGPLSANYCKDIWTPLTDQLIEEDFVNTYDESKLEYYPLLKGQPNGLRSQNCLNMMMSFYPTPYNDESCLERFCFVCQQPERTRLKLRGLCGNSNLDNMYVPLNKDNNIMYSGWKQSDIYYDTSAAMWTARVTIHDDGTEYVTTATTPAAYESLALGTHEWTVYNDSRQCSTDAVYTVSLSLSVCNRGQYGCYDGSCVSMASRCDGINHCHDKSDEKHCSLLSLDDSYDKNINPPPLDNKGKTSVTVDIDLIAILQIDEIKSKFYVKYILKTRWFDKRLEFNNLKLQPEMNILSPDSRGKIWVPNLIFDNTDSNEVAIYDKKVFIKVIPGKNFSYKIAGDDVRDNTFIFDGAENVLESERTYNTQFICSYKIHWYPFDTQTCYMDFIMKKNADEFIKLVANIMQYSGPTDLSTYFVRSTSICSAVISSKQGVRVKVVLGRPLLSTLLTTFLPTVLLNVIGHITNYFKPFFFEAVITVNLTVMLVLATM